MRYRHALVLSNPESGRGRGEGLAREITRLLAEAGLQVDLRRVGDADAEPGAVGRAIDADCDLVVIVGGDGTLRSYLRPLDGRGVPVLLVPAGTSNLIATHLRVPTRPRALVKLLTDGDVRHLDVAHLDGEPFVLAVGFGLATDVIQDADRELKRYLGPVAYLWSLLRNLSRRRVRVEMRFADGQRVQHRARLILFANCAETLAQVDIVPNAAIDDGLIDVAVFHFADLWQFLKLVGFAITGRWRRAREAVFYRSSSVDVWLRPAMPVQIDGDVFEARSHFRIDVTPEALPVLVPMRKAQLVPSEWLSDALTEIERQLEKLRTGSALTPTEIVRAIWDEYRVRGRELLRGTAPDPKAQRRGAPAGDRTAVPAESASGAAESHPGSDAT